MLCGCFEHQRRLKAGVGSAIDFHGHLPWVEVELFALSHRVSRCIERSDEGESASESESLRVAAFMEGLQLSVNKRSRFEESDEAVVEHRRPEARSVI